jgi:hypothetical protein
MGKAEAGPTTEEMKHPDPKLHLYISLVKSVLRIAAGAALFYGDLGIAGAMFISAEVLGIAEELV